MIPADRLELPVTGKVLQPFPFHIEYPIQEGSEFGTDVITSDDGTEQRVADRDPARPRKSLRGVINAMDAGESAALQAILFGWNRLPLGVPLWYDAMLLATATEVGDESVTVSVAAEDLADRIAAGGDVPVLLFAAHDDWEPVLLTGVAGGVLSLATPIAREWPVRTLVLPLQLMAVADQIELTAHARAVRSVELEFVEADVPAGAATACSTDDDSLAPRVLMVRGTEGSALGFASSVALDHVNADADNIPQASDPAPEHILFGYTAGVPFGVQAAAGSSLLATQKGRASGAKFCTVKCPASFKRPILGLGLGSVIGGDATLSLYTGVGAWPDVIDRNAYFDVEQSFTGSGYAPAPGPGATERQFVLAGATLSGGARISHRTGSGSVITLFGVYDAGAPGGIRYAVPDGFSAGHEPVDYGANANAVALAHGFAVRCRGVAAYKGVKIVCEEVLRDGGGAETGLFGDPQVETHDFTVDERDLDDGSADGAIFFAAPFGGSTIFGQAHDGDATFAGGVYGATLSLELYRVTVSLYDADDRVTEQFKDIFPTMLVAATVVV